MRASVVVRSKDEADRLRLTLRSLSRQTVAPEVVVVNDGSTDATEAVLDEAEPLLDLKRIHNPTPKGRSAAANIGAEAATGDILIFMDGDTLAGPDLVLKHLEPHRGADNLVARGETHQLRCTRFFANPQTGTPRPGEEARIAAMSESELARMRVTIQDVESNFASVHKRSQPGIYPGAGPRRLFDLEMDALRNHPQCSLLWAAASGSNQSVSRAAFLDAGGFHKDITINEHRELALRLTNAGLRMVPADGGYSYHLTHRSGWRDPSTDAAWEKIFYAAHPIAAVPLLSVFWGSLSDPVPFPAESRINSLSELETIAQKYKDVHGADEVRRAHFLATAGAYETQ
jgi:glycosyltransferase involved in cell wall biosynthesis